MERFEEKEQLSAAVSQSLNSDPEAHVRGQTLRTMAHMITEEGIEEVAAYLESDDPELRRGAMVGLIRGGIAGILAAGQELMKAVESPNSDDRILAADVVGEVGIAQFYQPLTTLLQDQSKDGAQCVATVGISPACHSGHDLYDRTQPAFGGCVRADQYRRRRGRYCHCRIRTGSTTQ